MSSRRSLQTILFTDIVASTDRATELGDRGWNDLLQEHHHRVRREIRRFGGREIKALGDGFLVSFPRPSQAVRCAWGVRESTRELGLQVRGGIHTGEVEHRGGDLSGIAVHICSRIAARAAPGEILVSNAVREMETGSGFRFQDRGKHELKGVTGEWRLFALQSLPAGSTLRTGRWIPELTTRQAIFGLASIVGLLLVTIGIWAIRSGTQGNTSPDSHTLASAAPAIAVMPFRVRGTEIEVLREGMVDLLSTGLGEASGVRAINPATLFARWREVVTDGEEPDLSTLLEIARQTGSRYAVIGSAIAVRPGIRLGASIYDLRTAELLGQEQVEGPEDAILQLVDHLTVDILRVILERGEEELPEINLASLTTDSPVALRAYLEGEVHFRHFDLQAAEQAFKQAIEADSMFALAYYRLADTYLWPTNFDDPSQHLERAVALSDRLPAEERVLVKALNAAHQNSPEAIESLHELVQTHPENAEAWYELADTYLHVSGAFATAQEIARLFERAVELDPKNAKYLLHHVQFAWWHEPDSAAAAHRVAMFEQVAPDHPLGPAGHLAIPLAFGDSLFQKEALTRLQENDDFEVVNDVQRLINHPRYVALPHVLEDRIRFRDDVQRPGVQAYSQARLFWYYGMWRGQLQEALSHIDQMGPPEYDDWRAELLYLAKLAGLPISQEKLKAFALIDSTAENWHVYWGGVLAADNGRWPEHSRAIAELEKRKEGALIESDSLAAGHREDAIKVLKAYAAWRKGNPKEALPIFSDPHFFTVGAYGRWRLAQVYQEVGYLEEAEEVYSSFHFADAMEIEPLAQLQLGRIYEDLGRPEEAVQSYEYFIKYWKGADPELQPMVEETRQAVIRVRGLQRE